MRRKISILVLLIVGILLAVIGWNLDKSGTTSKSIIMFISGLLLTVGMLKVIIDDLLDSLRNWIHR